MAEKKSVLLSVVVVLIFCIMLSAFLLISQKEANPLTGNSVLSDPSPTTGESSSKLVLGTLSTQDTSNSDFLLGTFDSCVTPADDMIISSDTTLCAGTYLLNDSSGDGLIKFGSDNMVLTCNDTLLDGDGAGYALYVNGQKNITIIGCNVTDYNVGVYFGDADSSNNDIGTLINITAYDNTGDGIQLNNYANMTILNSVSQSNFRGLYASASNDFYVDGLGATGNNNYGFYIISSKNGQLYETNTLGSSSLGFLMQYSQNIIIGGYRTDKTSEVRGSSNVEVYGAYVNDSSPSSGFKVYDYFGLFSHNFTIHHSNFTGGYHDGIYINDADDCEMYDIIVTNKQSSGIYAEYSDRVMISNSSLSNTSDGVILYGGTSSHLYGVTVENNTRGFWLYSYDDTLIQNSRMYNNNYGVYLQGSTANIFHHNDFIENILYQAYSDTTGNYFNTSSGGVSQGNYWSDAELLNIIDGNGDGYADGGSDYPYSAANNGNVTSNVEDYGSIIIIPATVSGECTIINSFVNGSVFYNSTEYGQECWIENSTVSYSTVTNSRIINSHITQSTILDSRIENTTFNNSMVEFSEVLHSIFCGSFEVFTAGIINDNLKSGRIRFNNADIFAPATFAQICAGYVPPYDPTPPTSPSVYDGVSGGDIDWFNTNESISAHWSGAEEDASAIYYKYLILVNDSDCFDGDCNFTSVGQDENVTLLGLSLDEGTNYSFVVVAYNSYGKESGNVTSDGAVLDITQPSPADIFSTTHPDENMTYSIDDIVFLWNATDNESGILGYSYLLDSDQGSRPDDVIEARQKTLVLEQLSVNYLSEVWMNGTPDHAYATFVEVPGNVSAGDKIYGKIGLSENNFETDEPMRFVYYAIRQSDTAGVGDFEFNKTLDAVSNIVIFQDDIKYASTPDEITFYPIELTINESVNSSSGDVLYFVIAGILEDDYSNDLMIGFSQQIDNSTQLFICTDGNLCVDQTELKEPPFEIKIRSSGDIHRKDYTGISDGEYWFHVMPKDIAGNFGPTQSFKVSILTDEIGVVIKSPADSAVFDAEPVNVTVYTNSEVDVSVVVEHPDGGLYRTSAQTVNGTYTFMGVSLDQGVNAIQAIATSDTGGTFESSKVYVNYDPEPYVTNTTLVVRYSETGDATGLPNLVLYDGGMYYLGLATENSQAIGAGSPMELTSDSNLHTTKIFMTTTEESPSEITRMLEDDNLLDQKPPSFGMRQLLGNYLVATQLQYLDIYLSGEDISSAGKYELKMSHKGITENGMINMTLRLT